MKALTLHPFYLELFTLGLKTIECRTWSTDYRGDILLTGSAKKQHDTIPGHALCIAELYGIQRMRKDFADAACMYPKDCTGEKFAWLMRNIRLIEPIPVKGKLAIWNFDDIEKIKIIMTVDELNALKENNPDEYDELCNRYWEPLYM